MSISKHSPNCITSLNLLCGVVGITLALEGWYQEAFLCMIAGGIFDFFDGFSARLLNAWSPIGKELDSLADQVTFGVLPSVMLFGTLKGSLGIEHPLCWTPLLIAAFSGLRLAKFNLDERQVKSFIGLPTPACAMICGSLATWISAMPESALTATLTGVWFIPLLSAILCILLVSGIPMFSMKVQKTDKPDWRMITFFGLAILSVSAALVAHLHWSTVILTTFTGYIIINITGAILKILKK